MFDNASFVHIQDGPVKSSLNTSFVEKSMTNGMNEATTLRKDQTVETLVRFS